MDKSISSNIESGTKTELRTKDNLERQSKDFDAYKQAVDSFAIVAETNEHGIITSVNKKFCEISKYTAQELVGQNHSILNSGFHPKAFFKDMWGTINCGSNWHGRICNQAKDGSFYWVDTYLSPKYKLCGSLMGFTALRFDITEQVLLEDKIIVERENATFTAQLAAVGEMSAGIAHEISNPLQIIVGRNSQLDYFIQKEKAVTTEKLSMVHNKIDSAARRIDKIVKGLLKLSQKSRTDECEKIAFNKVFEETIDFCREALNSSHIDVRTSSIPTTIISCHEIKVSQILLNLLNNSKDSILESKTKEKWIQIDVKTLDQYIEISITDSGPGIAQDIRGKIMESFFTTKPIGKGSGLGLSLVNRFVQEHQGEFFLKDTDKTEFIIRLPLGI